MTKKKSKTNPMLTTLIHDLKKHSYENDAPIWKDLATRLEKPSRNWAEVNLSRIDKHIKEKEIALIPGKVLSMGNLTQTKKILLVK